MSATSSPIRSSLFCLLKYQARSRCTGRTASVFGVAIRTTYLQGALANCLAVGVNLQALGTLHRTRLKMKSVYWTLDS